jgi:hypothetical protein
MPATTGVDVGAIFSDAMRSGNEAVNQFTNTYQQTQQMMGGSRRDIMQQPPQNPYGNIPNPNSWQNPQCPQYQQAPPQYQYQQPYNYGYPANNNGYGCSNNQVDAGYPGFSDPMYGKDPAAYRGGY